MKVLIILRGREMQHKDRPIDLMKKFANELKELAIVHTEPKLEGKSVIMVLSPLSTRGARPAAPGSEPES